jgi:orotate phosphoribosyltransferase
MTAGSSGAAAASKPARTRLLELLRTHAYERKRVTLASGKESDFFIDCKRVVLTAEGHALTGTVMLDALAQLAPSGSLAAVAGVALGGCPLASAVALTSFQRGTPLDAVYVRKEAKDHGSRQLIEGSARLPQGARVALLDDVVTTGGSTLQAAEKLRAAGLVLAGVVAIVDRLEGGRDAIEATGLKLLSLFTRDDFVS